MSCYNLILFNCNDLTPKIALTAQLFNGDATVTLNYPNLYQQGIRSINFVDTIGDLNTVELTGTDTTITPGQSVYPILNHIGQDILSGAIVVTNTDCFGVNREHQICVPHYACVSARANKFTYHGGLAESQLEISGVWYGTSRPLPNGLYSAAMRTEETGSPFFPNNDSWVTGSVRIVPWPSSRLRYKPFGAKLKGLWTTAELTDPRVANDLYLTELQLPPGV